MPLDYILVAFIILLQILDGWSTYYALSKMGLVEANLIVRRLIEKIGPAWGIIVAKTIATAGLFFIPLFGQMYTTYLLVGIAGLYIAVVVNNVFQILRIKQKV